MIGAPNSLNLNCKVRVVKEAPGPSVSEEIADIFTNYNIDCNIDDIKSHRPVQTIHSFTVHNTPNSTLHGITRAVRDCLISPFASISECLYLTVHRIRT